MNYATFSVGLLHFQEYGLVVVAAILICSIICYWRAKLRGLWDQAFMEMLVLAIPCGIIGGRFYYVLINWPYYYNHMSEAFIFSRGGFAVHGALLAICLFGIIYLKLRHLSLGKYADLVAPGLLLGQAVGQWANLMNQEAIGYPTNLSWGMYIDYALRPVGYEAYDYFHPAFIYQSLSDFIIFVFLLIFEKMDREKRLFSGGRLFLFYIVLQSIGRFFVEGIRIDSEVLFGYNVAQFGCLVLIGIALFTLLFTLKQAQNSNLIVRGKRNDCS